MIFTFNERVFLDNESDEYIRNLVCIATKSAARYNDYIEFEVNKNLKTLVSNVDGYEYKFYQVLGSHFFNPSYCIFVLMYCVNENKCSLYKCDRSLDEFSFCDDMLSEKQSKDEADKLIEEFRFIGLSSNKPNKNTRYKASRF